MPPLAIASLLLGLASLAFIRSGIPIGIFAIALGGTARGQISSSGGRLIGGGISLAGMMLGIIATIIWLRIVF